MGTGLPLQKPIRHAFAHCHTAFAGGATPRCMCSTYTLRRTFVHEHFLLARPTPLEHAATIHARCTAEMSVDSPRMCAKSKTRDTHNCCASKALRLVK